MDKASELTLDARVATAYWFTLLYEHWNADLSALS